MCRRIFSSFLLTAVFLPLGGFCQTPRRDPAAIAAVEQATAALGGRTAVTKLTDCTAYGTIQPAPNSSATSGNFVWKSAGAEFRHDFSDGTSTQTLVSGHGHPVVSLSGKNRRLLRHVAQALPPLYLPALVLVSQVDNPSYSLKFIGLTAVSGQPAIHIRTSLGSDPVSAALTPQDWYFDATSGMPLSVEYRVPDSLNAEKWEPGAAEFSDFRPINGMAVPFRILIYEGPVQVSVVTLASVTFNAGVNPADFAAPTGGAQ